MPYASRRFLSDDNVSLDLVIQNDVPDGVYAAVCVILEGVVDLVSAASEHTRNEVEHVLLELQGDDA